MAPTNKAKSLAYLRWLLLLPIPALWCVFSHYGWLTFLEDKSIDWRFQNRGELESPVKVVYVDIDSLSLDPKEIGGFPWSRMYYARVASALVNEAKVRAIGIDIVLSEAGLSESVDWRKHVLGNVELGKFLAKDPPVVLAAAYAGQSYKDILGKLTERMLPLVATDTRPVEKIEPPELPTFETSFVRDRPRLYNPPFVGLIDTIDGGTRWVPAWVPTNFKRDYFHMAAELARLYWGLPVGSIKILPDRMEFVRPDGSVQSTVPLRDRQLIEINWFSPWESPQNLRAEFSEVFKYAEALASDDAELKKAGKEYFAQEAFKDAVVLIGPVDKLLQDLAPTPFDDVPVPKVGLHGNLLKTIISGQFLQRLPESYTFGIVFALTLVVTILSLAGGARALFAKIMAVLAVATYVALTFQLFKGSHIVLPFTAPLGAAFTTSFAGLIWQVIEEQKAKGRIKGMFGAYVSPDLVDRMVESGEEPHLGGHDAEITAYFSDIQSFSTFSEKLGSGPLVELMNEYLTACTDIVQVQGGTLDKYIGDAVVAMFGAPIPLADHAFRACVATQLVHGKLAELRTKWQNEGEKWPQIVWKMQTRVGLNTGVCMIGNMGSRTRFNYTMMGDNVNLAARMESGAKSWGAYTMCAEATKIACEKHEPERVVFRPLGRIVVKGRTTAVPIFEIVGLKETVSAQTRDCVGIFSQALEKYYARDWDGALALFTQSRDLEFNVPGKSPGVMSNPSLVYLDITAHYKHEPPPENWDGIYVMKEK
jgi:adenylate cyclase